ncbi:TetR/AcrR family transcriptional regulator [Micromonospora sp. DR5-3]|uniref:TetR/AcrR family transcriptional regulator n=1 Tax=unclassified Micromonospora TaxID=2617518 RepID=UPI0011D5087C|nr:MULTISPECIES: TetR/AcrR family transcriptional regulator [unclassified Micromonospora]MCW3819385.1 TetR/AcrR family transcriptional regulator [Micromonospora sp. DR5-3]TYC20822.1 TetR/AcrR family transcriptional regulator [Micromonospora sp. MP36]
MADTPAPGTIRPGGRTARVRETVLQTAGDVLAREGFEALDLAEIARQAGVGKTTVYRRWGTPGALAADLLDDMAAQSLPRADTGSIEGDLRANAHLVVKALTDPRQGRLFKALIAASLCNEQAAEALHRFYATRIAEWAGCVTDAIQRGEIPDDTDAHRVIAAVSAPLYYTLLNTGGPLTEADGDRAAKAALAAARVGIWSTTADKASAG